jgi:hypothetical protein
VLILFPPVGYWLLLSAYHRYCLMQRLLASKWVRTKVSVGHGPAGHNEG